MFAKRRQSGFALLLFMVVLIGFITAGVSGLLGSSVKQKNEQAKAKTIAVLLKAKEALLSYAVDYKIQNDLGKMGKLPCPDASSATNLEGSQDASCGAISVNSVGLFPFKSVGLGKIEDANGECLWYVVSGDYKNSHAARMLNRDSVGYLNVVDENGNLKHGASEDDFPVALIISPGGALSGQNRAADAALPGCKANFTVTNYLEGGANIDYSSDLPATADTLWQFLDTSESAYLQNADHNDQVIAIYRRELWDRVAALKDLSFNNTSTLPPGYTPSPIESLTRSLAECIAVYGNTEGKRLLPYPAPLSLADFRDNAQYDDAAIHYGRFPQVVNTSIVHHDKFVLDASGASYCESVVTTAYDEQLWKNWKDHFFYIVSKSFDSASNKDKNNKCKSNDCMEIETATSEKKIAAMVIFAGDVVASESRIWWNTPAIDQKSHAGNYLEAPFSTAYPEAGTNFNWKYSLKNSPNTTDYAYCIEYDVATFQLSATKCANL